MQTIALTCAFHSAQRHRIILVITALVFVLIDVRRWHLLLSYPHQISIWLLDIPMLTIRPVCACIDVLTILVPLAHLAIMIPTLVCTDVLMEHSEMLRLPIDIVL